MRLLLLYDLLAPESVGGVELRNAALGRALASRGHDVSLAAPTDQGDGPTSSGYRIQPLGPRWRHGGRRAPADVRRFMRRLHLIAPRSYDLVETANIPYAHLPTVARACRRAGRPLLVTWHEIWGGAWSDYARGVLWTAWPLLALVERWLVRCGTAVITPSALTARRLPRSLRAKASVVPGGVWVEEMRLVAAAADPAPLVTVNRLIADKRLDLLIRAVALLRGGPRLDVIGEGPERAKLEDLARTLGIADRVRFRGRMSVDRDVWAAIAGAQVAVQPSAREGFGLFALEALALGVPVVHVESERSAVGEIARDGLEGLQADADPAQLAAALRRLLDDPGRRAEMASAARQRAADFDWSRQAERFETAALAAIGSG